MAANQSSATQSSATAVILGTLGGAMGSRVLDEWQPGLSYEFSALGRTFTIRATTAVGLLAIGAALAGLKIPYESVVLPIAAGAVAYELTAEIGDDVAALIMGLPPPGPPIPAPEGLPAPLPQPYLYPPGYHPGTVDDFTFAAAQQALRGPWGA